MYWQSWEMGRCPQHAGTSASSFSEPAEADGCSGAVTKPEYTWEGVRLVTLLWKGNFFFLCKIGDYFRLNIDYSVSSPK